MKLKPLRNQISGEKGGVLFGGVIRKIYDPVSNFPLFEGKKCNQILDMEPEVAQIKNCTFHDSTLYHDLFAILNLQPSHG